MVFFVLILAIIEFSLVVYDASRLAEATRAAARYAIVNDPACDIFGKGTGVTCPDGPLTCPGDDISLSIQDCDAASTDPECKMVQLMDQMMLRSSDYSVLSGDGQVKITYACSPTGDPALPNFVPVVTVEAIDVRHPMMFSSILGFYSTDGNSFGSSITLPSFSTSRTGAAMYPAPSP